MDKVNQSRENGRKNAVDPPALSLLANGSSGRWSVTLDETAEGAEAWFLQIEGPSLNVFCEVDDPSILRELARALRSPTRKQLVLGKVNRVPLRLQWDVQDDHMICFIAGTASRPLMRYSIQEPSIGQLAAAAEQAADDLD